jgi:hypothetical protein
VLRVKLLTAETCQEFFGISRLGEAEAVEPLAAMDDGMTTHAKR